VAPALSSQPHLVGLRREPEVGRSLVSVEISTVLRQSPAQNDRCSPRPERGSGLLWTLPTTLVTMHLRSLGIRRDWSVFGVESRSRGRLAGRDCPSVRRVGMRRGTVGFTYGTLPRAYEGSRVDPACCVVVLEMYPGVQVVYRLAEETTLALK
jgi:hypothetical protein